MSDTDVPADLIDLKRQFYETERELAELAKANPFDSVRWQVTHGRLGDLAVAIHRPPALQALAPVDRLKLDTAASRAAREQLAGG